VVSTFNARGTIVFEVLLNGEYLSRELLLIQHMWAVGLSDGDYSVNYLRLFNRSRCQICTKKCIEGGKHIGHSTIISIS
jgi:hypothetical protein